MRHTVKLATLLVAILSFTALFNQTQAQSKLSVHFVDQVRSEAQLAYNCFIGPDAADFTTTVDGFGSGLLDAFGMRTSIDLIRVGTEKAYISVGAGFSVLKYRLSKNLVFGLSDDNRLTWTTDPDVTHNYVNTFFGYGKSKIITTSFYFPLDITFGIGKNLFLSAGGYADLNLTARYKMKYLVGEDKVKEIIKSDEFRKFGPNTTKFGVNVALAHKKLGLGLSATYSLTPFFSAATGPDIHEARICATFGINPLKKPKTEDKD